MRARARIAAPKCSPHNYPFDAADGATHFHRLPWSATCPGLAFSRSRLFTPVLLAGCVILLLNFAVRASFGMFQIPIASDFGWVRSDFSMAIAIQNLAWGIGQPIFGAIAEKFGDRRAIIIGALMYSAGLGITTTSALGAAAISVIGLANIAGSITAGWLGKRYCKKYLLAGVYTARTIVSILFIMNPMTPVTVLLFSAAMGSLWLATVPLTSGLVAHIYGLRYMGTLYGLVFFSHQLGSFLGVWLGGKMYDISGDYTAVWWIGIGVGAFSALVHLPIRERPLLAQMA